MKKFYFLLICLSPFFGKATVITVSNAANSPGQFTNLQTAINSAAVGDTLYVHGGGTSYGNINIKKRLTLIGTGHNPQKANPAVAQFGIVQLDSLSNASGASGTKIIGFKLNEVLGYSGGTKNVLVSRNYFTSSSAAKINVTGSGWTIENNIINPTSVTVNNKANIVIRNNIFNASTITISTSSTVVITNNIFFQTSTASAFTNVSNALITNNIFSGSTPHGTNVNANVFDNNITYQTANDSIPFGTNTGTGNFISQNPQYVNAPSNTFNYSYDYSLAATSPGKNAGTDGTDIGVFGGPSPSPI
ncbi:MAG: hypothetical protein HY063_00720 [Bacteroidetes bacterium]|nr:hypothetical protein [Bacteroidota bacterium]